MPGDAAPAALRRARTLQRHLTAAPAHSSAAAAPPAARAPVDESVDACIVGMGFSGLALTYKLREAGFTSLRSFETGSDVGGTWFWNRYPGCACDIDSFQYSFSFSKELEQAWNWSRRYGRQPEILAYANHAADRFRLRSDTLFATRVTSADYDEARRVWVVRTDRGDVVRARFLFMANGVLSAPATPGIQVSDAFRARARCFHTHDWDHSADLAGKVVGIIGTGSTATQAVPELAKVASKLYVFQRTPAWCAPRQDKPTDPEEAAAIKADYAAYRLGRMQQSKGNLAGNAGLTDVQREAEAAAPPPAEPERKPTANEVARALEADPEMQRQARDAGGFSVAFTFGGSDEGANEAIDAGATFGPLNDMKVNTRLRAHLAGRIADVVKDPGVAAQLTPDYPVACKRLCITDDYWPTFNRSNVRLVSLAGRSVETIGAGGPLDADGRPLYDEAEPLDVLVFATGYDAMTGASDGQLGAVRGVGGRALSEKYRGGVRTYLGMLTEGFPNAFFMVGPQSPSVLSNMVGAIEQQADWLARLVAKMRADGAATVDVRADAEREWAAHCRATAAQTVWGGVGGGCRSWYNKANVARRTRDGGLVMGGAAKEPGVDDVLPYTGGQTRYAELCEKLGFSGLVFR